jgi:hypothetical protein
MNPEQDDKDSSKVRHYIGKGRKEMGFEQLDNRSYTYILYIYGMVGRITSESLARRYEGRRGRLFRVLNLPIFDERLSYYYYHH